MTNLIVEQMPFAVTKGGLIEARFHMICDAKDFHAMISAKYPGLDWAIVMQFYNERGALMVHTWGTVMDGGEPSSEV